MQAVCNAGLNVTRMHMGGSGLYWTIDVQTGVHSTVDIDLVCVLSDDCIPSIVV